jgi:hypothetical protein
MRFCQIHIKKVASLLSISLLLFNHSTFGQSNLNFNGVEDTLQYHQLQCGLFVDSLGNIAYQTKEIYEGEGNSRVIYLDEIYNVDIDAKEWMGTPMKDVIDTNTFIFLSEVFWKDKNHIYVIEPMSDGGHILVLHGADLNTFSVYKDSWYARDTKRIYYKSKIVKGVRIKHFEVLLNDQETDGFDGHHFFQFGNKIPGRLTRPRAIDQGKRKVKF